MEKQTKKQINRSPPHKSPPPSSHAGEGASIRKLGGIHLYNQNFKRYLSSQSLEGQGERRVLLSEVGRQQEESEMIEREIRDFIERRESQSLNISSAITPQLQNIIQTLKHSHVMANRFLEEHQHHNQSLNTRPVFTFQELFESERHNSRNKESKLVRSLLLQFNRIIAQEVSRIKEEEEGRRRAREGLRREAAVQTTNYHDNELLYLRKELERMEVQYNALYSYKREMLNEGENIIKNHEVNLELQKALITKLQSELAAKNLENKNLKAQFKLGQEKLISKVLDLQRIYNISQARSSLSSIQESLISNDATKESELVSNFISKANSKKNRLKKRAESILSITHSLFSNKKDREDLVASSLDFNAESLRETNVHFDKEFDDEFIEILKKASKKSAMNLFKILQIFEKNRNKSDRNHKRMRNMGSNTYGRLKNSSKGEPSQKQSSRRETESVKSKERGEEKNQEAPQLEINSSFAQQEQASSNPTKQGKVHRELSFQKNIVDREAKKGQNVANEQKNSILKSSFKDLAVIEESSPDYFYARSNKSKLKKGVSFQIINEEELVNLDLHSRIVNICIGGRRESEACTEALIREKQSEPNLEIFDKLRFSKNKLVKTRLKEQTHKKVNSAFDSQTLSNLPAKEERRAKGQGKGLSSTIYHPSRFSKENQRLSYQNSQEKIMNTNERSKQRNSFSRLERGSITLNSSSNWTGEEREAKAAKQMAVKCRSKEQYHRQLVKLHSGCHSDCEHIRRYLQFFDRCREQPKNEFKLKIENINNHIKEKNLPVLSKANK